METRAYAQRLHARLLGLSVNQWKALTSELVEEARQRDDLAAVFELFPDQTDTCEARVRVVLRRAFRARFGPTADIVNAQTTTHHNFGRF